MVEFNRLDQVGSLRDLKKEDSNTVPKALESEQIVAVVAYCLNPNHFHLLLKQLVDGGIAKFMQKLQAGYTYYFNVKNQRSGSLFQGTFKSNVVSEEAYLNKIFGYVNKNYAVHSIPESYRDLVFASDFEYEHGGFKLVNKIEGDFFLKKFNGAIGVKKHCDQIINIIRQERGKAELDEDDNIPSSA
jgi:REP element-mobilizing transposase RayT